MAERRMFSKSIIRQDKFMDLPLGAQALYMHLLAEADDEGFIGNVKRIKQMIGARTNDLNRLYQSGFVIGFSSGVAYIKDWSFQNLIRKDRLKETIFSDEKRQLSDRQNDRQND